MNPITLHPVILYSLSAFTIAGMAGCGFLFWELVKKDKLDMAIFIDKSNRWSSLSRNLYGADKLKHKEREYLLAEDCGLINKKGKALYVFSENKPAPLKLRYNDSRWLSSESIMSILNNDLIQKLVRPTNALADSLMLFGSIGGVIAGIASVLILLKQFGVL